VLLATILATCMLSSAVTFPEIKRPWRLESMSYSATYALTQTPDSIQVEGPLGTLWLTPTTPVLVTIARPAPGPQKPMKVPAGCRLEPSGP